MKKFLTILLVAFAVMAIFVLFTGCPKEDESATPSSVTTPSAGANAQNDMAAEKEMKKDSAAPAEGEPGEEGKGGEAKPEEPKPGEEGKGGEAKPEEPKPGEEGKGGEGKPSEPPKEEPKTK